MELNIAKTRDKATIGFTIIDLMVVFLVIVILVAAAVPVVAGAGGNAGVQQSVQRRRRLAGGVGTRPRLRITGALPGDHVIKNEQFDLLQ